MNESEIGYKEFQEDVYAKLSYLMEKYSIKIDNSLISESERSYICVLTNSHCKIELNLALHFPHVGLSSCYYLKDDNGYIKIGDRLIPFFNLTIQEIDNYFLELVNAETRNDDFRKEVQFELEFFKNLMEKFFYRLLDGSILSKDYKDWLSKNA